MVRVVAIVLLPTALGLAVGSAIARLVLVVEPPRTHEELRSGALEPRAGAEPAPRW